MRVLGVLAAMVATLLIVAACGGGNDDDDPDPSGSNGAEETTDSGAELTEDDLAEAMLLVPRDLPADEGWIYEPPSEDNEPNPFDRCDRGDEGLIGAANGGDFSRGDVSEISQDIRIFDDIFSLERSLDGVEDEAECMADVVANGDLNTEEATFSDFTIEQIGYRKYGDRSRTYRIEMTVTDLDRDNPLDPFPIFLDMVFVAIDNVGMRITASDAFKPYPRPGVSELVLLGEKKVRAALAADPIGSE